MCARVIAGVSLIVLTLVTMPAGAQNMYIYPAKGQSQAQQDKDRYECYSWAVKQTGFDPSRAQAAAPSDSPPPTNQQAPAQRHVVRGAARGAALGAVGGAITGNA